MLNVKNDDFYKLFSFILENKNKYYLELVEGPGDTHCFII